MVANRFLLRLVMLIMISIVGHVRAADPPQDNDKPAAMVAAELDEATAKRGQAALDVLRTYEIGNDTNVWAGAIRELIEIGKPAVPALIQELDQTQRQQTLRALGFVLRGIGDARAVPALIRAIPRTLQPGMSDYGLAVEGDDALLKFMQKHCEQPLPRAELFSYGRPFREVFAALHQLTGQKKWEMELNFMITEGSAIQRQIQRELYGRLARDWAGWLSTSWQQFVADSADAQLGQIAKTVTLMGQERRPAPINSTSDSDVPIGPNVIMPRSWSGAIIRPFNKSPGFAFLDLDANIRLAAPPKELVATSGPDDPSKELLDWAEKEGIDLIGVQLRSADTDKVYCGAKLLRMRAWRIDDARLDTLLSDLQAEKPLELGPPLDGLLAPTDRETGKLTGETATFLFVTREGACGAIKLIQGKSDGSGPPGGTSFDIYFIYDKSKPGATSDK